MKGNRAIRHVVWDWNGTLLDDTGLCIDIMNGMLAARGLPALDLARYHQIFDFPVIDYYRRLGFDFDRESFAVVGAEFIRRYEVRRQEAGLHPAVRDALDAVSKHRIPQSILSAYQHSTLESFLLHFGLRHYFTTVLGSDNVYAEGKIDQGRRWMKSIGLTPDSVLLVGDTTHDFDVAASVGCSCLLVADGYHPRSKLDPLGAPVLDGLHQFPDWLDRQA